MGELRRQTLSGVKWTFIETVSLRFIQFGISVVLARLLVPADYGLLGMIGIFMAVASTFVDSGMANALIRKKETSNEDLSTVFYFNIVISLIAYGALFFIAPLIADFFNEPVLVNIVRVVSINLILGSLGAIQQVKFTIDLNFKIQAKISTISSLLSGCIGIVIAYKGFGVWALVYQTLSSKVLTLIMQWMFSKWRPKLIFSKKSFKELFGYGSKLLASGLLHTIYTNITTLLIGKFYTPAQLGYYTRADNMPTLVQALFLTSIGRVTFPLLAKMQDNEEKLIDVYRKYIKSTSLIMSFVLILLASLSKPIILILLTDKWAPSIPFMQIICFCYLLDNVCQLNLNLLQVKGRSDLFLKLEVVKKSISLIMILCALPFGVMAICIARCIYAQIAVYINTFFTGRLFRLGYLAQIRDFGPYILYSLLACLPGFLLTYSNLNLWLVCGLGLTFAIVLYATLLWIFKDKVYYEYFVNMIMPKISQGFRMR